MYYPILTRLEKILLIDDFGLQKTSEFYMNRVTNYLIPIIYIHEIIINETIMNVNIKKCNEKKTHIIN